MNLVVQSLERYLTQFSHISDGFTQDMQLILGHLPY